MYDVSNSGVTWFSDERGTITYEAKLGLTQLGGDFGECHGFPSGV